MVAYRLVCGACVGSSQWCSHCKVHAEKKVAQRERTSAFEVQSGKPSGVPRLDPCLIEPIRQSFEHGLAHSKFGLATTEF